MAALDAYGIRYLIVGGIAVAQHGHMRATKDLDILVHILTPEQDRLYACLKSFGAPMAFVKKEDFGRQDFVFYFGAPPWRIDILTSIPGVDFEAAYAERIIGELTPGHPASFISIEWLMKSKEASGRPQDLADLAALRSIAKVRDA